MAMIEFQDIHKWYGEFHVLKGISEKVEKGEVLVICGPSGSGKSTFIRCLNRLEPIQRGAILLEGLPVFMIKASTLTNCAPEVGMVFPAVQPGPASSLLLDNVTLAPIKVRKMQKAEAVSLAMDLLKRVGNRKPRPTNIRWSFPAVSNSVWPSPAPWRCSPRSCSLRSSLPSALDPEMIRMKC